MLGTLLAVISAACFGFNNASARRGVLSGTAVQALAVTMPIGVVVFLILGLALGQWADLSGITASGVGFFVAAGIGHFVWGRYFNMQALKTVGANVTGPVQQTGLLLGLTLAVVVLGETLTPLKLLGIALVVSAPAYILRMRRRGERAARARGAAQPDPRGAGRPPGFNPRMAEGYAFALLSALGYGSSSVLIKLGINASGGLSLVGGFISYCAAAAVVLALLLARPALMSEVRRIDRSAARWFTTSGVAVGVSQMFRFLALSFAPVTVIQPLQNLAVIFRMIFGWLINREHELFDRYVIFGMMLSFSGAVCLSISAELLTGLVPLPGWLADLATWRWP